MRNPNKYLKVEQDATQILSEHVTRNLKFLKIRVCAFCVCVKNRDLSTRAVNFSVLSWQDKGRFYATRHTFMMPF